MEFNELDTSLHTIEVSLRRLLPLPAAAVAVKGHLHQPTAHAHHHTRGQRGKVAGRGAEPTAAATDAAATAASAATLF